MKLHLALGVAGSLLISSICFSQATGATETLAPKSAAINRKMVDQQMQTAQKLRQDGNIELAVQTTVSVINQLDEHGYDQDSLRLMREMTLDSEPAFSRAGGELLAKYYYQHKYLSSQPYNADWLMEARAWAVYSGNNELLASFLPKAEDPAHQQAISQARARGEELRADDRLFLAFEMIRANQRAELRAALRQWPYDINRAHSQDGTSLLHKAVWYKKTDIVRMLIDEFKANVNVVDTENDTPLDYAQYQQAREIIDFLKPRNAQANKQYGSNAKPVSKTDQRAANEPVDQLLQPAQPMPYPNQRL